MNKITTLFALLLFAVSQGAIAQKTITGKVINSDDGLGMIGVTVVVKGTLIGTTTDNDGNFTLKVPLHATLVTSFVGFKTVELPVENQTQFDVTLERDVFTLDNIVVTVRKKVELIDNVVVTSFGIERDKTSLPYAIQQISNAEITKTGYTDITNVLKDKLPSSVSFTEDARGAGPKMAQIILRGQKSFTNPSLVLYVLDGVPMGIDSNILSTLNHDDIENVTILKSANAAILYGSQGANGAIVITLKK